MPGIGATGIIAAVKRMRVDAGVEINEDDHRDTGGHVFRSVASSAMYHARKDGLAAYGDDEHVRRTRHAKAGIDGVDTFLLSRITNARSRAGFARLWNGTYKNSA